jgi:hypothetical protein
MIRWPTNRTVYRHRGFFLNHAEKPLPRIHNEQNQMWREVPPNFVLWLERKLSDNQAFLRKEHPRGPDRSRWQAPPATKTLAKNTIIHHPSVVPLGFSIGA